jgi:hypothetical protein
LPETDWMIAACPALADAVNTTGEPTSPGLEATKTWLPLPAAGPRGPVADASPIAFVETMGGEIDPPPDWTLHRIVTPATGLPCGLVTRTTNGAGSGALTAPVCAVPANMAIVFPWLTAAVAWNVADTRPIELTVNVCAPALGPNVAVADAWPDASVVASEGETDPPPVPAEKVTERPATITGLSNESVT